MKRAKKANRQQRVIRREQQGFGGQIKKTERRDGGKWCVCVWGGAFWVIIGVFFFPLSVPRRVFSPFDLGSDSVDDITTKTVPVHSVVGSFCPTFSLKMTSRPVPALSQYLYDEEDEVRKKKPRRKLPSNAAITRVRRAHLSPPPPFSASCLFCRAICCSPAV